MSLENPFELGNAPQPRPRPPKNRRKPRKTCKMRLPLPADALPGELGEICGALATRKINMGDAVSKVEVDVCSKCKARHDSEAAALRHRGRKKAS